MVHLRIQGHSEVRLLRGAITLLLAAGLVCLALFFWYTFEAQYSQALLRHEFDAQQNNSVSTPSPNPAPPPPAKHPMLVGRLEIPRLGVEVMVVNGADAASLREGAGWLPNTAWPGDGNAAIAAHRDTFFRPLRHIRQGDTVLLTTRDARYRFRVEWTAVVDPDDTAILRPTDEPALTLITCYPFYYVGSAPQRFIVRAARQQPLDGPAAKLFQGEQPPAACSFGPHGGPGNLSGAAD